MAFDFLDERDFGIAYFRRHFRLEPKVIGKLVGRNTMYDALGEGS